VQGPPPPHTHTLGWRRGLPPISLLGPGWFRLEPPKRPGPRDSRKPLSGLGRSKGPMGPMSDRHPPHTHNSSEHPRPALLSQQDSDYRVLGPKGSLCQGDKKNKSAVLPLLVIASGDPWKVSISCQQVNQGPQAPPRCHLPPSLNTPQVFREPWTCSEGQGRVGVLPERRKRVPICTPSPLLTTGRGLTGNHQASCEAWEGGSSLCSFILHSFL
jgi:hypothetical protein